MFLHIVKIVLRIILDLVFDESNSY